MNDPNAANEAPPALTSGPARQRLSSLRTRWGVHEPDDWRKVELVMVKAMDYTETWAKVDGGTDPWFELREKREAVWP